MKKAYIAPQSEIVALGIQGLLALSFRTNETETVEQWSKRRGSEWNSENWTQTEEE